MDWLRPKAGDSFASMRDSSMRDSSKRDSSMRDSSKRDSSIELLRAVVVLAQLAEACIVRLVPLVLLLIAPATLVAQSARVLQLNPQDAFGGPLSVDRGVAGLRQRLLELRTTASVMQTTAHPDDEQSGLLTLLSRGTGARTALLTLNRGEGGANAVGSELFDALGLLRTEELLLADHFYGLDDQYFTAAADYGYSKTIGEAARSWDTTAVLADMVRIIRQNQPLVVIARWYGGERDGHGHHQLAGVLTPLAVAAAADPARFPEQLTREGLQPWHVARLFRANLRADERADVVLDAGRYDPWLGESYQSLGADGLSRQRSQTGGRRSFSEAAAPQRLQQLTGVPVTEPDDLFSGLETSLLALFSAQSEREPPGARRALRQVDRASTLALATLKAEAPWTVVPLLLTGLRAVRAAQKQAEGHAPHAALLLRIKAEQFERAIIAALALQVTALAGPPEGDGHPLVPGETASVQLTIAQASPLSVVVETVDLVTSPKWPATPPSSPDARLVAGAPWRATLSVTVPTTAVPDRPHYFREQIAENSYRWRDGTPNYASRSTDALRIRAALRVAGEVITVERTVRFRRTLEPEGISFPRMVVLPPVSLRMVPAVLVVKDSGRVHQRVTVEVTGFSETPTDASVGLAAAGNRATMTTQSVHVARGARQTIAFDVTLPRDADSLVLNAYARVDGAEWRDEVATSQYRALEPTYLYSAPVTRIRRVPVTIAAGLKVAYVMGVGDLVPDAIAQLGADVTLLEAAAVTAGEFDRFDAVVIGTRAYSVRPELAGATSSIMAYAKRGGNVVVLYQTQEFRPQTMAPFPASLPDDAEETTEQDAVVRLLVPTHPLLAGPNRITPADFDGWIEQRGSKFLTQLSPEYTALVAMHDTGQQEQLGVWVSAPVGAGRWTYVALALHRQLPYAVPGAFRILANLLTRSAPK